SNTTVPLIAAESNSGSNAISPRSARDRPTDSARSVNSWPCQCRITPSRSTMSAAMSVIALRDRTQHAVDEAAGVVGGELRREFDGFGDHHCHWHIGVVHELVRCEP